VAGLVRGDVAGLVGGLIWTGLVGGLMWAGLMWAG
jgi:hypothetical protein